MWSDSGFILKLELFEFAGRLDMRSQEWLVRSKSEGLAYKFVQGSWTLACYACLKSLGKLFIALIMFQATLELGL